MLTSGLIPAAAMPAPGENEPVAIGTLEPIFSVAFSPSTARICGFCSTRVLESVEQHIQSRSADGDSKVRRVQIAKIIQ